MATCTLGRSSGEEGSRHGKVAFSRQSKHRHQNAKKEKNIREGSGLGNVAYNAQSVHRNRATSPNGIETGEDVLWKSTNFARKGVGTKMAFILDRPRIDSNYPKNTAGTETLKTSKRRTSDQKSSEKEPGTSGDSSSLAPDASYHADSVHDIVEYFANDVTTLHALPNVFKSCTLLAKCMWSIIFLTGVFLFLFQTSLVIRKYRSGPIQVLSLIHI
ncbi:uncharacterized protein LOC117114524 [Anneissia japonica]|uniref:uncharacterized protein LOC117114524 n=1 Tax=Anneissia japonica TaxID=1529436 RepID=UPI0014255043|nr:uncharacterized protein LOC117114524 [Anneissia japonica]